MVGVWKCQIKTMEITNHIGFNVWNVIKMGIDLLKIVFGVVDLYLYVKNTEVNVKVVNVGKKEVYR